ncbi:DUF6797 domain-containing protein [Roseiconus lacunae]|uniref:DUF6797 domain-containing protein n=2 Tax=Roseiconus lacunae TaxID=2605694 RepID=UPI001359767B|nr:DUF6797 domain-containing protein [Roseiconus lacunae]
MRLSICFSSCALTLLMLLTPGFAQIPDNFRDENLVAWCIVPFDSKERSPSERAEMASRLGLKRVAYDWRAKHVPTFEDEILQYQKHGIEYFAFWGVHDKAFELFEKYDLHPQIWHTLPSPPAENQAAKVKAAAEAMLPIADKAKQIGSQLGLYNHGGWGGEPENMVAVCQYLREHHDAGHVGIVYNLHHGHSHVDNFPERLAKMQPYLLCLNLNGMIRDGDQKGKKIVPLGEGEFELQLMRQIIDAGYEGPIGIIGHTQDDVEQRLSDNLDGLHWLLPQLEGKAAGPRPKLRTYERPSPVPSEDDQSQFVVPEYSPQVVSPLIKRAQQIGDRQRGLMAFANHKTACVSCHRIGEHGGSVGPDLSQIGRQRKPTELIEAVLWPNRQIDEKYTAHAFLDSSGKTHQGYIVNQNDDTVTLADVNGIAPNVELAIEDIEASRKVGSLMPENLAATLTRAELFDLVSFLTSLGTDNALSGDVIASVLANAQSHAHAPESFPYDREPLHPELHPDWTKPVNRDRVYDYYSKQADHFRGQSPLPPLLTEYPGLDGGTLGHWGNQNDTVWADGRWNDTDLGSLIGGIFRSGKHTIPRAVCVSLGGSSQTSVCFNPESLRFEFAWQGGFVTFSDHRHGFLSGISPKGKSIEIAEQAAPTNARYEGYYRYGERVLFSYRSGGEAYLAEAILNDDDEITIQTNLRTTHPLAAKLSDPKRQWQETFETEINLGQAQPYAVDSIGLPFDNPYGALFFCGGHGFQEDGTALVCTMQGDVWRVSDFAYPSTKATWSRFASGLHHPQGMVVDKDGVFVLGRDQITRLHDLNDDGEADFYECFSNVYETSAAGHDFICGLQRDSQGRFYTASGNQGVVRISADGQQAEVIGTGFRNPDGLGVMPDGMVTVPCSEGTWTPSSMICAFRPGEPFWERNRTAKDSPAAVPHFGYRGPINGQAPSLPLVYLPRGIDNSSGGQTSVPGDRWGPLKGQMLHVSFGTGTYYLVLRDQVDGQWQGAAVPLPGEFRSGAHRAKFNPHDGQLYVTGTQGWGSYTPDDGCFARVRYTGESVQLPIGFRAHENGIAIRFAQPLDETVVGEPTQHFAQAWNYRYSAAYGSPEFSTRHLGIRGHDTMVIRSASVLDDGQTLFLEIPDIQPVNQLHLRLQAAQGEFHDLFATVHALDRPRQDIPGYAHVTKQIHPHPMILDMAMATRSLPNPYRKKISGFREITIETATNLSYQTRSFRVRPGEAIALTLMNPDVVPHNWALVKPDALETVGRLADKLISDPEAALRHYVPDSPDVLAYTDVVLPQDRMKIYFRVPQKRGHYPYLCTFPGHWKVMNGVMIVE